MNVQVIGKIGYCDGGKNITKVLVPALEKNKTIYSIGDVLHNEAVMNELKKSGLKMVEKTNEIPNEACFVICGHGLPYETLQELTRKKLKIIDCTCGGPINAQNKARTFSKQGRTVIIIGDSNHAEVKGIQSLCKKAIIVSSIKEVEKLIAPQKVGVVLQTTTNQENAKKIIKIISKKCADFKYANTICKEVVSRENIIKNIGKNYDLIIVVGGKSSANVARILEAAKTQAKAFRINLPNELKKSWFKNKIKIGVTGGASTPKQQVLDVANAIKKMECN